MPGAVPCEAGTPQGQKRHHDQHQRLRLQLQLCLWVEDQRNGLEQTGRWRRWCISPWPHVEARTCDTQSERPSVPRQPIHVHASTAPSAAHWLVLVHGDTNTRRRFTHSTCWVTPMGVMIVDTAVQKLPRAAMPRWILPAVAMAKFQRFTVVCVLVLALLVACARAGTTVWPKPQLETVGTSTFKIEQATFKTACVGVSSTLLDAAMKRTVAVVFGGSIAASVTNTPSASLVTLNVNVKSANTSLDLDTDESCELQWQPSGQGDCVSHHCCDRHAGRRCSHGYTDCQHCVWGDARPGNILAVRVHRCQLIAVPD